MTRLALLALLVAACCPSRPECERSARRYAEHVPGAAGVECGGREDGFRYCSVWREKLPPVSVRCDDESCTALPAPSSDDTLIIYAPVTQ